MFSIKKLAIIIAVVAVAGGIFFVKKSSKAASSNTDLRTYKVQKRDLTVNVIENGTIESVGAYTVKSQVEGNTTIISIIPEGETITQKDIDDKRVIVELDSSGLREKISQQEITYNSALASLTEAKESFEIQKNQNDSDIKKGELNVLFSLMDLQKYLGEKLADAVIADESYDNDPIKIVSLISNAEIGGEALQTIRQYKSDIDLKEEELERAQEDLKMTKKLVDAKYVAPSDLKADQIKVNRLTVDVERAHTNLSLFERYEFAKQARKLLSDYREAQRELERIKAKTRSQLAQAEAKLSSQDATYRLNKDRFEKLQKQIEACIIYAEVPGMVVYATERNRWAGARTNIEMGASVRERQEILTIPDSLKMAALIKIHESSIDKVKLEQSATITIDAMPDKRFFGKVTKIAPLPDPAGFLSNPDMKVYSTEISIEGEFSDIRPGMSAKVSIVIEELKNVLTVPLQCVASRGGNKVCYVLRDGKPQPVVVKTGSYNDSFVQIVEGISENDEILLSPPKLYEADKSTEHAKKDHGGKQGDDAGEGEKPAADQAPQGRPEGKGRPDGL